MKRTILFIFILLASIRLDVFSSESPKKTPHLDFTYLKRTDGSRLLKANLYLFENRVTTPISNAVVTFHSDTSSVDISTGNDGIAYLLIDSRTKLALNIEGKATFKASYHGNDSIEEVSAEILVREITLKIYLEVVDSVRTVKARLTDINKAGDTIPLAGENINIYVPRMFSLLKVGDGATDADGFVSIEFPNDLPGNPDSTITVIAKLEESEQYANIEAKQTEHWGVPAINIIPQSHRALWTQIAPVWMIITLTVMLCGVWGHYIFVIIQLILVKIESRKQKAQNLD